MNTPKISSPYMTSMSTQFIPKNFLKNGVMIDSALNIRRQIRMASEA
ncbi:MAG: hypothetical protein JHD23_01310 [Akkermansiaceae bacterium]|jgi:hypothetical protein|nr:hypothetical protein [Akkermansiaceae bacterium]MBJ7423103.1 hypothetical protein [Akkermansiaceae bacterium]